MQAEQRSEHAIRPKVGGGESAEPERERRGGHPSNENEARRKMRASTAPEAHNQRERSLFQKPKASQGADEPERYVVVTSFGAEDPWQPCRCQSHLCSNLPPIRMQAMAADGQQDRCQVDWVVCGDSAQQSLRHWQDPQSALRRPLLGDLRQRDDEAAQDEEEIHAGERPIEVRPEGSFVEVMHYNEHCNDEAGKPQCINLHAISSRSLQHAIVAPRSILHSRNEGGLQACFTH
mmetsp:Transcript_38690/g.124325  ORF Transcript_38690/g.124325 Transcript_38690/m.124325 type:complete len:234 (-) Transcript_38690:18-719(-)